MLHLEFAIVSLIAVLAAIPAAVTARRTLSRVVLILGALFLVGVWTPYLLAIGWGWGGHNPVGYVLLGWVGTLPGLLVVACGLFLRLRETSAG